MVVFQPGGAQDRAQLLRQLDVNDSSAVPAEAVIAIRRWYRLLQRAADLNIALPDESLQVRSLSNIVKKTADMHADFKFRVALAKTELQIDSRPSQQNVMRFLQHLLAELEQLGAGSRRVPATATTTAPSGTTTTAAATSTATGQPSLKGVQPVSDASGGQRARRREAQRLQQKEPCQWFGTDGGCRNGKQCTCVHSWSGLNRGERCLLCGSKQHRAKECGASSGFPGEDARASATSEGNCCRCYNFLLLLPVRGWRMRRRRERRVPVMRRRLPLPRTKGRMEVEIRLTREDD